MALKHMEEYRDAGLAQGLVAKIKQISKQDVRLMEVCGTHTMSIFRSGIRSVIPNNITLLSGPGCPVCVTAQGEIDAFIRLAQTKDVIVTTFGDLMRVPGTQSSLQREHAEGADIRVVYSTFDALAVAQKNPSKKIVFLGVGFETTAPTIAAAITTAHDIGLPNFYVWSAHKLVPPALNTLMHLKNVNINGFILPGHVSVVIGVDGYKPFFDQYRVPCVVTGFEPADVLQGISMLIAQIEANSPRLENAYPRAVTNAGNTKAQDMLNEVFQHEDAVWRGIGVIPHSGLGIREKYAALDAQKQFGIEVQEVPEPPGCACGEILSGAKIPPECALFKKACTPMDPIGPCMVSTEGTCAAYYRYYEE